MKKKLIALLATIVAVLALGTPSAWGAGGDRENDIPSFYGGDQIAGSVSLCSSSFMMFDGSTYWSATANHCAGYDWWASGYHDTGYKFGTVVNGTTALDVETLQLAYSGLGVVWADPDVTTRSVYNWETTAQDLVGNHVCSDGKRSHEVCGLTNTAINVPTTVAHENISRCPVASVACVIAGDSGGPMYATFPNGSVEAVGIITDEAVVGNPASGGFYGVAWMPIRSVMSWIWANVDRHLNLLCQICTPEP